MTEFQKNVIALILAAIGGNEPHISGNIDFEQLYNTAKEHQIIPLIYYGLSKSPKLKDSAELMHFFKDTCMLIAFSEKQKSVISKICGVFEKSDIKYMLLKGCVLKPIYPMPEMRLMSDADILIDTKQYEKIKCIMHELKFVPGCESDHELTWFSENHICVELHKRLIPSYNKDYYDYFGDGWNQAKLSEHGYVMSPDNNFIYLFTHFAKHYRDSGVGIKYVVDFYVFKNKFPGLNEEYIKKELSKLQLLEFYKNIMYLLDVWFGNAEPTGISDFLTEKIFGFGTYGLAKEDRLSEGLKLSKNHNSAMGYKLIKLIFPNCKSLENQYPILKKCKYILPVMWVVHWFDVMIFRRGSVRYQAKILKNMSSDKIKNYKSELNYVGLDFNFK